MEKNTALSESIVADLNDVIEEDGVKSNELRSLGANSFDVILMANTIDFLTNPREVFRQVLHYEKFYSIHILDMRYILNRFAPYSLSAEHHGNFSSLGVQ